MSSTLSASALSTISWPEVTAKVSSSFYPRATYGFPLVNQDNSGMKEENFYSKGLKPIQIEELDAYDISAIRDKIKEVMLSEAIAADKFTVVVDLDGTITIDPDPSHLQGRFDYDVAEKGDAVAVIKELVAMGVNVVISSAWDRFDETLYRLHQLDLLETMGITDLLADIQHLRFKFDYAVDYGADGLFNEPSEVEMFAAGNIVSARISDDFFREKARAPYGAKTQNVNETKYVFFADDTTTNITRFKSGLLYSNVFGVCERAFIYSIKDKVPQSSEDCSS